MYGYPNTNLKVELSMGDPQTVIEHAVPLESDIRKPKHPLITAAQTLKGRYKHQPVVEFELLDHTIDMPFLNVTMTNLTSNMVIEFWNILSGIDSKHQRLQTTDQPDQVKPLERLLITGHPGAGKTTLMRQLAKEWAEGRALQSCQILFLIHLDRLSKDFKPQSLSDLLMISPHKDLKNIKQVTEEIQSRHGAGTCFLLDAYNEWNWKKDYVHSLLFNAVLHSSICVLTSRPHNIRFLSGQGVEYIEIVGFSGNHLEDYLHKLSTDEHVIHSVSNVWTKNNNVRDMCVLPLNMVMIIFIAKHAGNLAVHTKTQIYSAFVNVTVKHFLDHHPDWNTVSLRECILNTTIAHEDELCAAFQYLHHVAFEMLFNQKELFPEYTKINRNIYKLGFVNVTKLDSSQDQVKYTFFHPTFLEFFAALHLLKLPQEERLYLYIKEQHSRLLANHNLWLFFFGLIGDQYKECISTRGLSAILKQFSIYYYSPSGREPHFQRQLGYLYGTVLEYVQETGWVGKELNELLESAGFLVNSTLHLDEFSSMDSLRYVLNRANIHKLEFGPVYAHWSLDDSSVVLDAQQLEPLISCFGYRNASLTLLSMTHLHLVVWPWDRESLAILDCLMKIATNLNSLHAGLEGNSFKAVSTALVSIKNWGKNLKVLSLNIDLRCNQIPAVVNRLQRLPTKLILKLKINLTRSGKASDECLIAVPLFDGLKHPKRLQKLTIVFPKAWFKSSIHGKILHTLTGLKSLSIIIDASKTNSDNVVGEISVLKKLLKHFFIFFDSFKTNTDKLLGEVGILRILKELLKYLSVFFDYFKTNSDKLFSEVSTLKELSTLEVQNCQPGECRVEVLLKNLPLTLQELNLDHNNLTDHDIIVLAETLKDVHDLKSLSLRYNSITGNGLKPLVKALKLHGNFHSLDLSGNPIKENGLQALGELSNLTALKLTYYSNIGDSKVEVLVDALVSNKNLHSLNLSGNPCIGSEAGLEPLAQLTNLRHLDISDWPHQNQGIQVDRREETLSKVLAKLIKLQLLNLCSEADIPIHWSVDFARTISQLPELQLLSAPCLTV